jgi:ATP-dependent DNA ligase
MAFDLLYHERRDLTARPLRERRARLEDVVTNNDLVFPMRRLAPDGLEAWAQVVERGYEGLVAKDEASAYEAGRMVRVYAALFLAVWFAFPIVLVAFSFGQVDVTLLPSL